MQMEQGAVAVQDAFSNPLFRLGYGSQSPLEATEYPTTRMTQNYALLNSLYRDSWIVQNIITTVPDDMLRQWVVLTGVPPEAQQRFERLARKTALRRRLTDGLNWGRLYGGAVGVMLIKGQDLSQPLDFNLVRPGAFVGLYIVDRWSGVFPENELVTDLTDPDFGLPAWYTVRNAAGAAVQRVHHSHIVRFIGRELPFYEKLAEQYWGESELEAIFGEIVKRDNVSHNMAALTFRACRDYMEVENADQLLSIGSPAAQERFWKVLQAQSVLDSNFGMRVVNKGDAIHNTQYTFTGLSDVYESVMMDVSGASRIPVTKLFGRSPAGMNATGESDLQNYYDYIDGLRESVLRPILERLLPVLALSCWGELPEGLDIAFPPLWTPKAIEVAEIAERKAGTIFAGYQAGLLDQGTAQRELKKLSDETGLFDAIPDAQIEANMGVSYQDRTAMQDPLAGLLNAVPAQGAADADPFGIYTQDYPGQPRDDHGRFAEGKMDGELTGEGESGKLSTVSATGTNKFSKGFSSGALKAHFKKHSAEYPGISAQEYESKALQLLQSPAEGPIRGYKTAEGAVVRYNTVTNDYAKGYPSTGIATMFKPKKDPETGLKYYLKLQQEEGITDG